MMWQIALQAIVIPALVAALLLIFLLIGDAKKSADSERADEDFWDRF